MRVHLVIRRLQDRQHSFVEIAHEIFPNVILSLPLIQDGQLSVSGERMCTNSGKPVRGISLLRKSVVRYTDPNVLTRP